VLATVVVLVSAITKFGALAIASAFFSTGFGKAGLSAFTGFDNFFESCLALFSISFSIFFELWPSLATNAFY
jgi:hypothetical protein